MDLNDFLKSMIILLAAKSSQLQYYKPDCSLSSVTLGLILPGQ